MLDYKANPLVVAPRLDTQLVPSSGAVGSKTGKTSVLPGFSKIERGGGSGGAPHCYGGLT